MERRMSTVSLTPVQVKLLNDFMNTVQSREINADTKVLTLGLSYDVVNGYSVTFTEVPKAEYVKPVVTPPEK